MSTKTKSIQPSPAVIAEGNTEAAKRQPIIYHIPENLMKPLFNYLIERPSKETAVFVLALQQVQATDPNPPQEEKA